MKKFTAALVAAGLVLATSGAALAISANGTANATVIAPIAIAATATTLEFGNIVTGAGTVVINAETGVRTGTAALITSTQGTERAGTFTVTGSGSLTYAITLPGNSDVVLTTGDGADATKQIPASSFTSFPSGTGTLSSGTQTLSVGATLTLDGSEIAGNYTDTYSVTVEYN